MAQTFKSEHGNYSDGFRKAFHHETISYNRRKDREYVELVTPRLSALLSGTPKQVSALVPSAENGLFSRFIFYYMNILPVWKDVFAGDENTTLDDYFRHLGNQFFDFYKSLQHLSEPLRFCLTKAQQQHLFGKSLETWIKVVNSYNQIESECKFSSPVSIFFCNNTEYLHFVNNIFNRYSYGRNTPVPFFVRFR